MDRDSESESDRQGAAVVIGDGGIGAALAQALLQGGRFVELHHLARRGDPPLDLTDEASIAAAAARIGGHAPLRLVVDATGFLHGQGFAPEKSWDDLDAAHLAHAFAVNATGPALLMKHFLPRLTDERRAVFATLSARLASIADNRLGGWYAYRASKAALNQLVRSAAVELRRRNRHAICVALHPGTVETPLSAPFAREGLEVQTPDLAAARLLAVIDGLETKDSGGFFDQHGAPVPW